MEVHLYTRCWNDASMLGFFFRHYDGFVTKYVIYDDGSTDGSLDILRAHPRVDLRQMPPYEDPQSRVLSSKYLQDKIWQESKNKADWVILTDIDEHIFHTRFSNYLEKAKRHKVTVIPIIGFQMISETLPEDDGLLSVAVTSGMYDPGCNKPSVFSPDDIEETNFAVGRHAANFRGRLLLPPRVETLLLHYKFLGFERLKARHALYLTRQRPKDLDQGMGFHYGLSEADLRASWNHISSAAVDISRTDLNIWRKASAGSWWAGLPRVSGLAWWADLPGRARARMG
jgi:hypothetical protein